MGLLAKIEQKEFQALVTDHALAMFTIVNETLRNLCFATGFEDLKIEQSIKTEAKVLEEMASTGKDYLEEAQLPEEENYRQLKVDLVGKEEGVRERFVAKISEVTAIAGFITDTVDASDSKMAFSLYDRFKAFSKIHGEEGK